MSNLIFFFNDTATTEIYTLSLHDALPISQGGNATGSAVGVGRNQSELRMHLEEARTALQNDNTEDALIHLDLALNVLGGARGIQGNTTTGTSISSEDPTNTNNDDAIPAVGGTSADEIGRAHV